MFKGGIPMIWHNDVNNTVVGWIHKRCNDVCTEPDLESITGKVFSGIHVHVLAVTADDGARQDIHVHVYIAANGFAVHGF